MHPYQKLLVSCTLISLLTACGSGGNSESTNVPAAISPAPAATTSQGSSGTITGFGSVYVNGVEWETDDATFEIDDDIGSESDLKVGHIVTVYGTVSSDGKALADSIEYEAELEGPISAINLGAGTITVLGHVVVINSDTVFDDDSPVVSIEDLSVGEFVEINGYPMSDGSYLASYLEIRANDGEVEVHGVISNLDTGNRLFRLKDLVVDYTSAVLEDFDGELIAEGQHVEVEGSSTLGSSGQLIANKVELEDDHPYADDEEFEIEGVITAVNSDGSIVVAGLTIAVGTGVEFENGGATDIAVDVRVEVEGDVNASGALVATEIKFKRASRIEVEAPIQSIDTVNGTVTVLGIVFHTTLTTQFEDDSDLETAFFDLADMAEGDWVEIKAFTDGLGDHIATRVERDDADDRVELKGPIDSVAPGQITVLGVRVTIDVETELDGFLLSDLAPGMIVEIDGLQTGEAAITTIELELEDESDD